MFSVIARVADCDAARLAVTEVDVIDTGGGNGNQLQLWQSR